jgi:hypothetical protein
VGNVMVVLTASIICVGKFLKALVTETENKQQEDGENERYSMNKELLVSLLATV